VPKQILPDKPECEAKKQMPKIGYTNEGQVMNNTNHVRGG